MKQKNRVFIIGLILIGIILRFLFLSKRSLWADEFWAVYIGQMSFAHMVNFITYHDAHPPLFYEIVHFWLHFGNSAFILRIIPALAGVACIWAAYILGREILNEKIGFIFAAIITFNPAHILWSQIVKSYSLFTFLAIISIYFFFKVLKKREKKYWFLLGIINIILLYLHNLGFVIILIETITVIVLNMFDWEWLYYCVAIFICYIPWLLHVPHQLHFTLGVVRPFPPYITMAYSLFYFALGETVNPFMFYITIPAFIILIYLIVKGLIEIKNISIEKRITLLIGLLSIFPICFFPSIVPQNILPLSIFWYILISLALFKISEKSSVLFKSLLSLVILLFLISDFFLYAGVHYNDKSKIVPYKQIGRFLTQNVKPDDIILTTEGILYFHGKQFSPISWYYKGPAKIIGITDKTSLENLSKKLKKYKKIWVEANFYGNYVLSKKLKNVLSKHFKNILDKYYVLNRRWILDNKWIAKKIKERSPKPSYYYLIQVIEYQHKK
jgi:uncharacterized membrane protein